MSSGKGRKIVKSLHNSLQINFLEYDVITEINTLNK